MIKKMMLRYMLIMAVVGVSLSGVPKKNRVIDQPLSDKEPGSPEYDHEAFVGKEEAKEFDELSPEESRRRLGIIVDKMDKDGDSKVTEKELHDWIVYTQARYIHEDSDKQFQTHDKNKDNKMTWDEYKESTYGFLTEEDMAESETDGFSYRQIITRDEKRWERADVDGDKQCSIEEFRAFLHPEDHDHMKDLVIKETMDDMDKNKDGAIDLEEYIGDMHNGEDEDEPEWLATERKQFVEHRDLDNDGKMNEEEVKAWIMPDDYNHAEAESKHLIQEADDNSDGTLTKEEILTHHDKFVGSQATDWGEALKRHDEF